MQQRATAIPSGIKEKLVFVSVSTVLALSVYHLLVSQPVLLEVGDPTSAIAPPGPLDPEKLDTRMADVRFYLENGSLLGLHDPKTGVFADRGRANPFQPIEDPLTLLAKTNPNDPNKKGGAAGTKLTGPVAPPPDIPVAQPEPKQDKKEKIWTVRDNPAKVDFSGVITMNGKTVGLLKSKDGSKTMQVKVGDYLDDYKYTVASIEKQAIYVVDEEQHVFIARDQTFDADSSAGGGGGDDEKPAPKKDKKGPPAGDAATPPEGAAPPGGGKPQGKGPGGGGRQPRPGGGGRGGGKGGGKGGG